MIVKVSTKTSRDESKVWYYLETGKGKGERWATKEFTYAKPKDLEQKEHNRLSKSRVENLRATMVLKERKFEKVDFIKFYQSFVLDNARPSSRHLKGSLDHFTAYISAAKINPGNVDEDVCLQFRNYLVNKFNGRTPRDYFIEFKRVVKAATKAGCFTYNPAEDVKAKINPMKERDFLTPVEYLQLCDQPCPNDEIRRAFIFSLYTGFAFCDVKALQYSNIKEGVVSIYRQKSKVQARVPLHSSLLEIILTGKGLVFALPTANGCNKILKEWVKSAGIEKHITWHCSRHSFSIELLRKGVAATTVAGLMGHTTIKQVSSTYRRYVAEDGAAAILKLPSHD